MSGAQVSPTEIEEVLRAQPDKLIEDACVAGVSGGRTSDEKVPRAWVVLSAAGKQRGAKETLVILEAWAKKNLSKYKWLRGGFEVVGEVSSSDNLVGPDHSHTSFADPKESYGQGTATGSPGSLRAEQSGSCKTLNAILDRST